MHQHLRSQHTPEQTAETRLSQAAREHSDAHCNIKSEWTICEPAASVTLVEHSTEEHYSVWCRKRRLELSNRVHESPKWLKRAMTYN